MLVVLAAVASALCLVLGLTVGPSVLLWVGLGLSLAGLALLFAPTAVRLRRAAMKVAAADVAVTDVPPADVAAAGVAAAGVDAEGSREGDAAGERVANQPTPQAGPTADAPTPEGAGMAMPEDVAAPGTVSVVPGRRRYHRGGCRLLAGRESEEISLDEAREEGFTACTTCIPDRSVVSAP